MFSFVVLEVLLILYEFLNCRKFNKDRFFVIPFVLLFVSCTLFFFFVVLFVATVTSSGLSSGVPPPAVKKDEPVRDSEEKGGDSGSLDLNSANAIIQQQQAQIQALLQQQHQLQNQANSLLAPALQVSLSHI